MTGAARLELQALEYLHLEQLETALAEVQTFVPHWKMRSAICGSLHKELKLRTPGHIGVWSDWQEPILFFMGCRGCTC